MQIIHSTDITNVIIICMLTALQIFRAKEQFLQFFKIKNSTLINYVTTCKQFSNVRKKS